jgi:hypothetical protein
VKTGIPIDNPIIRGSLLSDDTSMLTPFVEILEEPTAKPAILGLEARDDEREFVAAITEASVITGGVPDPIIITDPYFIEINVIASMSDVGIFIICSNYFIIWSIFRRTSVKAPPFSFILNPIFLVL